MNAHKYLKEAAAKVQTLAGELEKSAAENEQLKAQLKEANAKLASTKAESDKLAKTASAEKAELADLAKKAATQVKAAGLLSSDKMADEFAAMILTPKHALAKLAEVAKYVTMPKVGKVVDAGNQGAAMSADAVWAQRVRQVNGK